MGINCNQLREYIVRPTLEGINLWSKGAENLLLGTCAQETLLGTYLHQIKGPGIGIYSMETRTHDDIWKNFLDSVKYRELADDIMKWAEIPAFEQSSDIMGFNLYYATAMARAHYYRVAEALPHSDDIEGLAKYWKRYYNTHNGKGTEEQFIKNYKKYVLK